MAVDKLVDSTQLDSDLTSVANAIRTKGGTSAQLAFPAGFVSAIGDIQTGGVPLGKYLDGTNKSYTDDTLTYLATPIPQTMTEFICHNIASGASNMQLFSSKLVKLALPALNTLVSSYAFSVGKTLTHLDLGITSTNANYFAGNTNMATLILRSTSVVPLNATNCFTNTPFKSGGTGGTIYIPKALYDHLGDNSALDYKAATNWSTVDGYGTITWAAIEGSMYESKYADGTDIPQT